MKFSPLKIKVDFEDDKDFDRQIRKFVDTKLSPELAVELKKVLFTKAKASRTWWWKEFEKNLAGLFPVGLMKQFERKKAIDSKGSMVSYNKRKEEIDLEVKIQDDVAKEFENDPIPYIIKAVAGLDSSTASKIWQKALQEAKKETEE